MWGNWKQQLEKKSRRSNAKYPALEKKLNLKTRQDAMEIDYLHKLNDEEKAWLNKFNAEFVGADFRHEEPLHTTPELKQDCELINNARNRDVFSRKRATGELKSFEELNDDPTVHMETVETEKQKSRRLRRLLRLKKLKDLKE